MKYYYNMREVTKDELFHIFLRFCKDHNILLDNLSKRRLAQTNGNLPVKTLISYASQDLHDACIMEDFLMRYDDDRTIKCWHAFVDFLQEQNAHDAFFLNLRNFYRGYTNSRAICKLLFMSSERYIISSAFPWGSSKEGFKFWGDMSTKWCAVYSKLQ